jgi:hypothetical protein
MISNREVLLTQEQAEDRLRYWQGRLGLLDWDIQIVVCRAKEINGGEGQCYYQEAYRQARIWITDKTDHDPVIPQPLDMEQTLVHELSHIVLAGITRGITKADTLDQYNYMEIACESFAWALVGLDRRAEEIENFYMDLEDSTPPLSLMAGDMYGHTRTVDQEDGGQL